MTDTQKHACSHAYIHVRIRTHTDTQAHANSHMHASTRAKTMNVKLSRNEKWSEWEINLTEGENEDEWMGKYRKEGK